MRMVDLIQKKKLGGTLSKDEIDFIISGFEKGEIPDYQISALLMAIYYKGMNSQETADLTDAFVNSGERVDLSSIDGTIVDKHSTGGVGDKISLIVLPLVASVGIPVAKLSGKGLGHTGGTIDKLESIEGFKTELSNEEFIYNVNNYKMAIISQTNNLTPADKKIYSLRDVTATVDSIPLIASSIMSKKIASGADAIVLDVKVGSGAFMKSIEEATELAKVMVNIGKKLNKNTVAVITNMNQPLGNEIGNSNEIKEVIDVLRGNGPEDETIIALTIASHMCVLGGAFNKFETAYEKLMEIISSGKAVSMLKRLVNIQGGNGDFIDNPDKFPQAKNHIEIKTTESGYINLLNAEKIGVSAMLLGAGRKTKEDKIDHAAGISLRKKVGDKVEKNDVLCVLHTNYDDYTQAKSLAISAFTISNEKSKQEQYIYNVIQ